MFATQLIVNVNWLCMWWCACAPIEYISFRYVLFIVVVAVVVVVVCVAAFGCCSLLFNYDDSAAWIVVFLRLLLLLPPLLLFPFPSSSFHFFVVVVRVSLYIIQYIFYIVLCVCIPRLVFSALCALSFNSGCWVDVVDVCILHMETRVSFVGCWSKVV